MSFTDTTSSGVNFWYCDAPSFTCSQPSFVWACDTAWIVYRGAANYLYVSAYPRLSVGDYKIISTSGGVGNPSVGYDKGGRLVVVSHSAANGSIRLFFKNIGSSDWNAINIPDAIAYGEPSLWVGQNEIRIAFEGEAGNNWGLIFMRLLWTGNNYAIQSTEPVSEDIDYDWNNGIEGYSYLAGPNLVLWKYNDDIWYAQRQGGEWITLGNLSQSGGVSSYPQGIVFGSFLRQKLFALWTEESGNNYYLVRKIINLPSEYPNVRTVARIDNPEATAYNNSRRLLRDVQGRLHLVFTSNNQIYHTFLQDTSWSEPVLIGEGKYPALALGPDGRIYCLWSYNQGQPDFLEELRFSQFDGSNWSSPIGLLHTYNSFFWGIGAPSLTIKDTLAYFCYKSYFGPTYHPEPGGPMPMVIVLESRHLVYGRFSINNPAGISSTSIDTIVITPTPYDPLVYQDSLIPLLISPSITVDLANVPHILWEGDSTNMRYYTITDSGITKHLFDNGVDFPSISMNGDQIQLFYTSRDSIRYRYSWTGTTNLSQIQTIASCESPIASNQYLAWTKRELPPRLADYPISIMVQFRQVER